MKSQIKEVVQLKTDRSFTSIQMVHTHNVGLFRETIRVHGWQQKINWDFYHQNDLPKHWDVIYLNEFIPNLIYLKMGMSTGK